MNYCPFTLATFRKVLKTTNGWTEITAPGTYEYIYLQPMLHLPEYITQVHSSISVHTNRSRPKGDDSIKVSLIHIDPLTGKVLGIRQHTRANRTTNWVPNLFAKIKIVHNWAYAQPRFFYLSPSAPVPATATVIHAAGTVATPAVTATPAWTMTTLVAELQKAGCFR
jgi:hypothetical protein